MKIGDTKIGRTTLAKLLLAATALMPVAASAQEAEQRDRGRFAGARQRQDADGGARTRYQSPRSTDGNPRASRPPEPVRAATADAPVQPDRSREDRPQMRRDPATQDGFRGAAQGAQASNRDRGNRAALGFLGANQDRAGYAANRGRNQDRGARNPSRDQYRDHLANRADRYDNWRDQQGFADRRDWNNGWRRDDRYDWTRYRNNNRYAYQLPRYYAPQGWGYGYRRFSIGITLNSFLFGENYWIDDPYAYHLPEAYGPYRWVRYYNDALLVDIRYGRVVDAVYDIFW